MTETLFETAPDAPSMTSAGPRLLAIDPGNTESAFVVIDPVTCWPRRVGKVANTDLLAWMHGAHLGRIDQAVIEMVASYGMPVGREVFDTCVWIGRFVEAIEEHQSAAAELVFRQPVKLHHCGSSRAKDSNITQALVDRFAAGESNRGKGTKAAPGWFYGFSADVWQAYALAVFVADTQAAAVHP